MWQRLIIKPTSIVLKICQKTFTILFKMFLFIWSILCFALTEDEWVNRRAEQESVQKTSCSCPSSSYCKTHKRTQPLQQQWIHTSSPALLICIVSRLLITDAFTWITSSPSGRGQMQLKRSATSSAAYRDSLSLCTAIFKWTVMFYQWPS